MVIAASPTSRRRADASRNRERIVLAAREAVVEHGADVPLDEVAKRAGVGNATLYRHFADRRALISAVTRAVADRIARDAEQAHAEEPTGFAALRRFAHDAVDERISALCPLVSGWVDPAEPDLLASRKRLLCALGDIIDRAQREGTMRGDVAVGDVLLALTQLTRPVAGTPVGATDRHAHRQLELLLTGLHAGGQDAVPLPGEPVTLEGLKDSCGKKPRKH